MKLGLGIATIIVLLGIGLFYSAPQVYSATSTPTTEEATAEPESSEGYQKISDTFFEMLAQKGGKEALTYAFSTNPFSSKMEDDLNMLMNQYTSAEQLLGEYIDFELLVETKVSDRVVVQYYLVIYERQPLKFEMAYYRPKDEWVLQNFAFKDIVEDISTITRLSIADSDKVTIEPQKSGPEGFAQVD